MAIAPETNVSAEFPFKFHSVDIAGSEMRYVDVGTPSAASVPTLLFLHDLIGMGESAKPQHLSYSFTDHYTFVSAFIKAVIPAGPIILVAHDWGTALGLHWCYQHPDRVAGIVLMEFVHPFPTWKEFGDDETARAWRSFRDPVVGHKLIVEQNLIMGKMIAHAAKRGLSEAELVHYRKPFLEPSSREVIWKWTTQIPIADDPADVFDIATRYEKWLVETKLPKLLFWCEEGPLVTGEQMREYLKHMENVVDVDVGEAGHMLQEDHPALIAGGIRNWLDKTGFGK